MKSFRLKARLNDLRSRNIISIEHLLLALPQDASSAGQLLRENDVTYDKVLQVLKQVRGTQRVTDQTPENKVRWGEYCLLDTKMTYHLWQQHSHKWPEHERAVSRHTAMIGARGIGVDLSKVTQGIELLKQTVWEAEQEIPWAGELTAKGKDIPATSPLALAAECRRLGIEPPATTEEKSEIFQDWLDANAERAPFVRSRPPPCAPVAPTTAMIVLSAMHASFQNNPV